ncbi:hypothetical protein CASFOL_026587 [Castilleja foliolosa]|uniref:Ribosomal protein L34Ae n=1 Tax=Castilleja foliolosa TaxID=1961234 RepID=A0ABD3CKT9_9LAMI
MAAGFFSSLFLCQKLVFLIHAVVVYLRSLLRFISRLKLDGSVLLLNKKDKKFGFIEAEPELPPPEKDNAVETRDCDARAGEEKTEELYLKFKFPTYEEFSKGKGNNNSNSGFTFGEKCFVIDDGDVNDQEDENNVKSEAIMEFTENPETETQTVSEKNEFIEDDECQFSSDKNSSIIVSDSEIDPHGNGFLSDGDFGVELDNDSEPEKTFSESELSGFEENKDSSDDFSDEEDSDIMEELKKLEEQNPNGKRTNFLSDKDFGDEIDDEFEKGGDDIEKPDSCEDEDDFESLWEHQELMEQLKMELKKVRATGLPTILEESESPKVMDDLKPWKIDEFERGDCLTELHKFYKSYRERMRKFDIINYQKMYAMGLLQLKDPILTQKALNPTFKSLGLFKNKIHITDPTKKLIQELQGDLEGVYVAQMCLSWEFLHWQYDKALDLWDSDPRSSRRYNEVADEFQQFQVLMQRFIEDEPFQDPRVQNYVKTRCAVRNLLQVPVIREDNLKDKRKVRASSSDEYVITSEMLVEIVEESIRIFWRFVRADKDCLINGQKKLPELPDPDQDLELLMEIKKNLQKEGEKGEGYFEERKLHFEEIQTVQGR